MGKIPIHDEYESATTGIAFLRRTSFAIIEATGSDTIDFLQGMVTADVKSLAVGESHRAAILDTKGHILADLTIHRRQKSLLIETDYRTLNRVLETLNRFLIMEDVTLTDRTGAYSAFSFFGPDANVAVVDPAIKELIGPDGWLAPSGSARPQRYDIWIPTSQAEILNRHLNAANITEIGIETYEVLRVEAGDPAWGTELTESVLLPEAEIAEIVSYTKGCYVGQEIIARLHSRGHTNRVLRRLLFAETSNPILPGSLIYIDGEDREVARITSAVRSPKFGGAWLALAYVRTVVAESEGNIKGTIVDANGNDQGVEFSVVR